MIALPTMQIMVFLAIPGRGSSNSISAWGVSRVIGIL
jgi:hypothetical protein